jgi:hypothetical protein
MKTKLTIFMTLLIGFIGMAQNGINYKAVIKDDLGNVIANDLIAIQFTILQGVTSVYEETHSPTTDANGIVMVNIGEGTPINGIFSDIDWGSDDHFLNVRINTGSGLIDMGTTGFKTVPYALHALTSTDSYWSQNGNALHYSDGNIGIGTNNPNGNLEVSHNSSLSNPHILLNENANDYARLSFKNSNSEVKWLIAGYIGSNEDGSNDRLNFYNDRGGDLMTITGDGEVGIGVGISPKTGLHVGNERRVLFGTDTIGSGAKLMWLPDLNAFRVGTLISGSTSTYWDRDNIGQYSFASGRNTRAQGYGATAMGRDTEATNNYAFASGFFSNADGEYSTAMGFNTDALALGSTALGYQTDAEANFSFAAGSNSEAQAIYSVAIGNAVQAQSYSSMAVGRYNVGGGNATSWVASDPIFEIGIGAAPQASARVNAFTVLKNGYTSVGAHIDEPTTDFQVFHDNGGTENGFKLLNKGANKNWWRFYTLNSNGLLYMYSKAGGNSNAVGSFNNVSGAYSALSDRRVKDNFKDLHFNWQDFMQLKPLTYHYKTDNNKRAHIGLVAQEVQPIYPELVSYNKEDDLYQLNYSGFGVVAVKAIQELKFEIEALSEENMVLKALINDKETATKDQAMLLQTLLDRVEALENDKLSTAIELVKN